jgi:hypothetical protein
MSKNDRSTIGAHAQPLETVEQPQLRAAIFEHQKPDRGGGLESAEFSSHSAVGFLPKKETLSREA